MHADKRVWESAEIQRSALEAAHTPDSRLVSSQANLNRYVAPPLDTVFPLEYAFAVLGDVRGHRVLDLGCGSGENTLLLARRGARLVSVDISESLIRLARRRLAVNGLGGAGQFVVASAHDLPVESESVDVVLGIAILHHLDLDATSREVYRVIKPGGRAIFQEPVRDSRLVRAVRRCIPYRAPDVSPFERPLTTPELRRFAKPFRSMAMRAFSLPFVNLAQVIPVFRRHIGSAYHLDSAILKRLPVLTPFSGVRVLTLTK
jgi:ubiquinone/menaquinone biosynthesis C-methylase UbiE